MTGTIEHLREFSGTATAGLIRLPRGLSLASPVTLGKDNKVSFEIQAAPDALVGSYNGVACEIVVDNGGEPMKQIAQECGFSDPAAFAHVFKAHTGRSPGAFRKHYFNLPEGVFRK